MRQSPDQRRRRVRREHGISVERDHVLHASQRVWVSHIDREGVGGPARVVDHGTRGPTVRTQQTIELGQLPALSLPPHPDALLRIPAPGAVQKVEGRDGVVRVSGIQQRHAVDRLRE